MARFRCKTCLGEYDDEMPDRTPYFHRCPPLRVKVFRNPGGQEIEIPEHAADPPGFVLVDVRQRRRPNERNENVLPDPDRKGRGPITAPGLGRESI